MEAKYFSQTIENPDFWQHMFIMVYGYGDSDWMNENVLVKNRIHENGQGGCVKCELGTAQN